MPSSVSPAPVEEGVLTPTATATATATTTMAMPEPPASTPASAPESRKRSAGTDDEDEPPTKRQKITPPTAILKVESQTASSHVSTLITADDIGKTGLRRVIALALQKVGFEGAAPEAMESFVAMAEMYLASMLNDIKTVANASRRSNPVPKDFEIILKRHNLSTSSLQPHKRPPIPKSKRILKWETLQIDDHIAQDLPILGRELDGTSDKMARAYIPNSFPSFPSIHTYRCTPESVEAVTAAEEWNLPTPDTQSQTVNAPRTPAQAQLQAQRPLAPDEIPHGDPKKMREAAAKEAKAGEAALRGLMRASKIAKQKEVWLAAQQDPTHRERHTQWESVMKELIEDETKAKGKESAPWQMHGPQKRAEIADHAMIVNAERRFYRREMPRSGARRATAEGVVGKW